MKKGDVIVVAQVHPVLIEGLQTLGYSPIVAEKMSLSEIKELLPNCTGIITANRLPLDRTLLQTATNLQWIGRMGSGMEIIDTEYAKERGIGCYSSPEGNCNAVAEHALGMLIGLTKKISSSFTEVKAGKWLREENRGTELEGKTVGIIGYGHTGAAFAKKLSGFDVKVLAYNKGRAVKQSVYSHVTICESLDAIYAQAEIVSFHVPLKPDTVNYLNAAFLDKMQHNFMVLNTARGEIIDTAVLLAGLENQKVIGAALDVWPQEPLSAMGREERARLAAICRRENVLITPHIAGYSHEATFKMSAVLLKKIAGFSPDFQ